MFSTENNEYAIGLLDENEWEEDILDYEPSLDNEEADYFENPDSGRPLYNEEGYRRERLY